MLLVVLPVMFLSPFPRQLMLETAQKMTFCGNDDAPNETKSASATPTPTIIALTYRTADAIVDRYLKNPGALA